MRLFPFVAIALFISNCTQYSPSDFSTQAPDFNSTTSAPPSTDTVAPSPSPLAFSLGLLANTLGGQIAVESSSAFYYAGAFSGSLDFNPNGSSRIENASGGKDIFLSKYDSSGKLQSFVKVGGAGDETVLSFVRAETGELLVFGNFEQTVDFGGASLTVTDGNADFYLAKYHSDLTLSWVRHFTATGGFPAYNTMAATSSGAVYLSFRLTGTYDFDPTAGTDSRSSSGFNDGFLVYLGTDGSYVRTTRVSGPGSDGEMGAIAVNSSNQVHWTSSTKGGADMDPGAQSQVLASAGQSDAFYVVYNSDGSFSRMSIAGGSAYDYPNGLQLDSSGNTYWAGLTASTNLTIRSAAVTTNLPAVGTLWDIWATKLSPTGSVQWAKTWGGAGNEILLRSFKLPSGGIGLIGTYSASFSVDFDPLNVQTMDFAGGSTDTFITLLNSDGTHAGSFTLSSPTVNTETCSNIIALENDLWMSCSASASDATLTQLGTSFQAPLTNGNLVVRVPVSTH